MTTRTTRKSRHDNEVNSNSDDEIPTFKFNGKIYTTYEEMVNAKRKRNQDMLAASGLLKPPQPPLYTTRVNNNKRTRNNKKQAAAAPQQPSRRSSRLSNSEKPNYKEVSTFIEQQAGAVVNKRRRRTATESRIVSPSPAAATPAPPAANSVRSVNIDTKMLVLGEKGVLGQMMDRTGKEFVINESFSLAAFSDDQKRLAGSRLSFNKYCGVQEFKNAVFLWINLGSKDNPVVNDFLNDAQQVTWFGGSRMHDESPVIHKLLKMGKQHDIKGGDDDKPHSNIILWCRRYQADTKQFTPYVCFGRLTYHSHVPQSSPLKFVWNLVDYDGLKNHSDKVVRERFAAFTT